ncbi:MAG: ABC transporter permease [Ligilactobacillus animalis]|uniref:ABC transporter permease n=1 Tax=Lactobacillaceae TaxID=33958 RepID=UPI001472FA0C|nr:MULTISPECIES: ABC transporter permease [Lactobacillaceae]MCI5941743.1 ABC transporter permease [Ligilactobacillus animalis]MCT3200251.1 ABC transporter permease [Limosilactobacillus reuteri]MDC6076244.1 ABC transporter permease [Limosilactobacillus reuteri]MDY2992375.1 ABC transporter permease [Ligilactobacillus animalis]NME32116.1 ABC transporter permease [Ligilactobacillus ruminis]
MFALIRRDLKIYFANKIGVVMSCLGALISFFIYIGFLQRNLASSYQSLPNAKEMLDLWMVSGIVAIAGITTSFQALGQLVKDRESQTWDDLSLTDLTPFKINLSYLVSSIFISTLMQIITFCIMAIYFILVDNITIQITALLPGLIFIVLGSIGASATNLIIVDLIHSFTTFSRLSAIIGAASGFMIATYMPYGTLSKSAQFIVKLFPSSYEAASLRSLLLKKLSKRNLPAVSRQQIVDYLGIHFKIHGHQLSNYNNALMILGMSLVLLGLAAVLANRHQRKS